MTHRLEHECVHLRKDQRGGLLTQRSSDPREVLRARLSQEVSGRSYGAADVDLAARCFTRDLHAREVELAHHVL